MEMEGREKTDVRKRERERERESALDLHMFSLGK